jgi:hypothetical protein
MILKMKVFVKDDGWIFISFTIIQSRLTCSDPTAGTLEAKVMTERSWLFIVPIWLPGFI